VNSRDAGDIEIVSQSSSFLHLETIFNDCVGVSGAWKLSCPQDSRVATHKRPLHKIGPYASSLLDDEDFSLAIKLHLQAVAEKDGHFRANTIVDYVASPEMQATLEEKGVPLQECIISVWTARRWLKTLDYRFGRRKNGMYVDGHEHDDVVKYCMAFVK